MEQPIVIIGIGELAGVIARAFLRNGYPVCPVTRGMDIEEEANSLPDPRMVLVGVAEKDFPDVMETIPEKWKHKLVLIQNELLPRDWEKYNVLNPTIMSVWFEKKKGMDYNPIRPSPVYGPVAEIIAGSLEQLEIPCRVLGSEDDLLSELVLKNVFVFTINIAGLILAEGTTTGMLWEENRQLALDVAGDVIDLQESITGKKFSRNRLREGLVAGLNGDPHHKCKGRSAHGRLIRTIEAADAAGLKLETIRDVSRRFENLQN